MAGGTSTQTFDFETMAVVLYALKEAKCTLGSKHYDMMSKASSKSGGSQSSNSFNHKFRAVKQRANDLLEQERAASGSTAAKGTTAAGKRMLFRRACLNKYTADGY